MGNEYYVNDDLYVQGKEMFDPRMDEQDIAEALAMFKMAKASNKFEYSIVVKCVGAVFVKHDRKWNQVASYCTRKTLHKPSSPQFCADLHECIVQGIRDLCKTNPRIEPSSFYTEVNIQTHYDLSCVSPRFK